MEVAVVPVENKHSCVACLEAFHAEAFLRPSCGHRDLCVSCARTFYLMDGIRFPLRCASPGCSQVLDYSEASTVLHPWDRWERLFVEAMLRYEGNEIRVCPNPRCQEIHLFESSSLSAMLSPTSVICSRCQTKFCVACYNHPHGATKCGSNKIFELMGTESLYKTCPGCNVTVEKTPLGEDEWNLGSAGCNHITCKCGKQFCWVCLKDYNSNHFGDNPHCPSADVRVTISAEPFICVVKGANRLYEDVMVWDRSTKMAALFDAHGNMEREFVSIGTKPRTAETRIVVDVNLSTSKPTVYSVEGYTGAFSFRWKEQQVCQFFLEAVEHEKPGLEYWDRNVQAVLAGPASSSDTLDVLRWLLRAFILVDCRDVPQDEKTSFVSKCTGVMIDMLENCIDCMLTECAVALFGKLSNEVSSVILADALLADRSRNFFTTMTLGVAPENTQVSKVCYRTLQTLGVTTSIPSNKIERLLEHAVASFKYSPASSQVFLVHLDNVTRQRTDLGFRVFRRVCQLSPAAAYSMINCMELPSITAKEDIEFAARICLQMWQAETPKSATQLFIGALCNYKPLLEEICRVGYKELFRAIPSSKVPNVVAALQGTIYHVENCEALRLSIVDVASLCEQVHGLVTLATFSDKKMCCSVLRWVIPVIRENCSPRELHDVLKILRALIANAGKLPQDLLTTTFYKLSSIATPDIFASTVRLLKDADLEQLLPCIVAIFEAENGSSPYAASFAAEFVCFAASEANREMLWGCGVAPCLIGKRGEISSCIAYADAIMVLSNTDERQIVFVRELLQEMNSPRANARANAVATLQHVISKAAWMRAYVLQHPEELVAGLKQKSIQHSDMLMTLFQYDRVDISSHLAELEERVCPALIQIQRGDLVQGIFSQAAGVAADELYRRWLPHLASDSSPEFQVCALFAIHQCSRFPHPQFDLEHFMRTVVDKMTDGCFQEDAYTIMSTVKNVVTKHTEIASALLKSTEGFAVLVSLLEKYSQTPKAGAAKLGRDIVDALFGLVDGFSGRNASNKLRRLGCIIRDTQQDNLQRLKQCDSSYVSGLQQKTFMTLLRH